MNIDLLSLIGTQTPLKKVAGTRGGEWHGPCPFCGGRDRFIVQPNYLGGRWYCRQCERSGDAIAYTREYYNLSYREACERLGVEAKAYDNTQRRTPQTAPLASTESDWIALSDTGWQSAASEFIELCANRLCGPEGERARSYLEGRGIPQTVQIAFDLGYNDQDRRETWGEVQVWLPRGIVIPWRADGTIWRVNIRRPVGDPKYIQPKGCANGLYGVDALQPGKVAVLVEGEIDAMSIAAGAPDMLKWGDIVPLATGSNTGAHLLRWVARVALADKVLLAFDDDDAGEQAVSWWQNVLGSKAQRLKPTCHDVNDMLVAGDDIELWLGAALGFEWAREPEVLSV